MAGYRPDFLLVVSFFAAAPSCSGVGEAFPPELPGALAQHDSRAAPVFEPEQDSAGKEDRPGYFSPLSPHEAFVPFQDAEATFGALEEQRRLTLPPLVHVDRVPFEGCFLRPEDRMDGPASGAQPILEVLRALIDDDEQTANRQKLPIVLVPGYMGGESFDLKFVHVDYWYGIPEALAEYGFAQVYPAIIDGVGYSSDGPLPEAMGLHPRIQPMEPGYVGRGRQLRDFVLQVLEETGAPKVNLVAHSQGSLTARWMISNLDMAPLVNVLVSLSGPHRGVPLTRFAIGEVEAPAWLYEPVEQAMTWFFGGITESENPSAHGSHVEMWPEYTVNYFNPRCPDMPGVRYVSFSTRLVDIGDTGFSPYLLSPFWALHEAYALGLLLDTGPNDGLVEVTSARSPTDESNWIYVGELIGKKVIPGTGIESEHGIYWGLDHAAFMNFPLGSTKSFHFDVPAFHLDLARLLNALTP